MHSSCNVVYSGFTEKKVSVHLMFWYKWHTDNTVQVAQNSVNFTEYNVKYIVNNKQFIQ